MPKEGGNRNAGDYIVGSKHNWTQSIDNKILNNIKFRNIVKFYLFNTIIENVSAMSIELSQYGWTNPWLAPERLDERLRLASTMGQTDVYIFPISRMREGLLQAQLDGDLSTKIHQEKVCIYDKYSNKYKSIIYHIRNSIAHGRFMFIKGKIGEMIILEDVAPGDNGLKVSARMVLKVDTILEWVKIITDGPTKTS